MATEKEINELLDVAEAAGLDGLDWLRSLGITTICEGYNGIGPEFLKPEVRAMVSQYLAPFAPAAVVHDLRNHFGDGSREKFLMANDEFRRNCLKLAHYHYKQDPQKLALALAAAEVLYLCVSADAFGWRAWLEASEEARKSGRVA